MKRNIMEHTTYAFLFHKSDKRCSFFQILQLDVIHMRIVNTALRNRRNFDPSTFRQRSECFVIRFPRSKAVLIDLIGCFQLRPKVCGVDFTINGEFVDMKVYFNDTDFQRAYRSADYLVNDMEKLNEIDAAQSGIASGYSMKGKLLGHLVMGAVEMQERAKKAGLSEEKTVMLQHMIFAHHYEPEFGSPVKPMLPVLWK